MLAVEQILSTLIVPNYIMSDSIYILYLCVSNGESDCDPRFVPSNFVAQNLTFFTHLFSNKRLKFF